MRDGLGGSRCSVAADGFAPVPLIALLRNPLVQFGFSVRAADAIEIAALRGPRPAPGAAGLDRAIAEMRVGSRQPANWPRRAIPAHETELTRRDRDLAAKLAEQRVPRRPRMPRLGFARRRSPFPSPS